MRTIKIQGERFISAVKRNKWAAKRTHGDLQAIHDWSGIPKYKVRDAFKLGYCDQETEKAIDKFYGIEA